MTDEQIVKALKICGNNENCCKCPYYRSPSEIRIDCNDRLTLDALDLIKRQQAEIKELQEILGGTSKVQSQTCAVVRAETVREFAERLKEIYCTFESFDLIYVDEIIETIEKLVREMTEKEGGKG